MSRLEKSLSGLKNQEYQKEEKVLIKKDELDFSHDIFIKNNSEINDFLKQKSMEFITIQAKSVLAMGKLLVEVFQKLSRTAKGEGLYEEWLKVTGINKRTALRYRKRFELYKSVDEAKRGLIAILPMSIIEEIIKEEENLNKYIELINAGATKEELLKELKPERVIDEMSVVLEAQEEFDFTILQKLNVETFKNINKKKRVKIESYLRKIELLLQE